MDFRKTKKDTKEADGKFEDFGGSQNSWDEILNLEDDMESVEMFSKFHARSLCGDRVVGWIGKFCYDRQKPKFVK